MRRFFRTFNGYMERKDFPMPHFMTDGAKRYSADQPGMEIIHSETQPYNNRCGCNGERYHARNLMNEQDWRARMLEAIEFMEGYDEIGCYTFCDCGGGDKICTSFACEKRPNAKKMILVDDVKFNAYDGYNCSFYIIFNAKPIFGLGSGKNVAIGRDIYHLKLEKGSIIVWNLERYQDFVVDKHTFWGICQNTGSKLSKTDDVMVGLKEGKRIYVARQKRGAGAIAVPAFFLYYEIMDEVDERDLQILDDELAESEQDGEEMLACGN